MSRLRFLIASALAPLAALFLPILLAINEMYAEPTMLPSGEFDDAPMRSAGLFLLIGCPVLFVVGACFYAAIANTLHRQNKLQFKLWIAVNAATPWVMALAFGVFAAFSVGTSGEAVVIGAIASVAMSLFACIGAIVWWRVASLPFRQHDL
jgi:hypothetical protein